MLGAERLKEGTLGPAASCQFQSEGPRGQETDPHKDLAVGPCCPIQRFRVSLQLAGVRAACIRCNNIQSIGITDGRQAEASIGQGPRTPAIIHRRTFRF